MRKLISVLLILVLVTVGALPVLAAEDTDGTGAIPTEDVVVTGPDSVHSGEIVALRVNVTDNRHGISSRIGSTGMELLGFVGGRMTSGSEERFELPGGTSGATFFYRITGSAGEEAILDVHDVHVFEDETDRMGTSKPWEATIEESADGQEPGTGPLTWSELSALYPEIQEGTAVLDVLQALPEGMTWDAFAAEASEPETALVLGFDSESGALLSDAQMAEQVVCTGQHAAVFNGDAELTGLEVIIVRGDVLGTGKLNISQVVRLAQAVNGSQPLEGSYLQAGLLSEGDSVDISDLVALSVMLLGRQGD